MQFRSYINNDNKVTKLGVNSNFSYRNLDDYSKDVENYYKTKAQEARLDPDRNKQLNFARRLESIVRVPQYEQINKIEMINLLKDAKDNNIPGITPESINSILNNVNIYNSNIATVNNLRNDMNENDRKIYDSYNRFVNGEVLSLENGGTTNDDDNINLFNKLWGTDVEYMDIYLGDKAYTEFQNIITNKEVVGLNNLQYKLMNDHTIRVSRNQAGMMPILGKAINMSIDRANSGLSWLYMKDRIKINMYDRNNNKLNATTKVKDALRFGQSTELKYYKNNETGENIMLGNNFFSDYAHLYDNFKTKYDSIVAKYPTIGKSYLNIVGFQGQTFGEQKYRDLQEQGLISESEANGLIDRYNKNFARDVLYGAAWNKARIFNYGDDDIVRAIDTTENNSYMVTLKRAYEQKRLTFQPVILEGRVDEKGNPLYGWKINIAPKYKGSTTFDSEGNPIITNGDEVLEKGKTFIVTGIGQETAAEEIINSDSFRSARAVHVASASRSNSLVLDAAEHPVIGDVSITGIDDGVLNFNMMNRNIQTDEKTATELTTNLNRFNTLKQYCYFNGGLTPEQANGIKIIASRIASIVGESEENILQLLLTDIKTYGL